MSALRVTACNPRATNTDVRDGVDVDVTCEIAGLRCEGEVTLVPDRDGGYEAYGMGADCWVSGELLAWLRTLDEGVALDDMLADLEAAAARCAASCDTLSTDLRCFAPHRELI